MPDRSEALGIFIGGVARISTFCKTNTPASPSQLTINRQQHIAKEKIRPVCKTMHNDKETCRIKTRCKIKASTQHKESAPDYIGPGACVPG
jgi:hypothetical protein